MRDRLFLQIGRIGHDHVLVDTQRHVAVDLDQQRALLDLLDRTVNTAGGNCRLF